MSWFKTPNYKRNYDDVENANDVINLQNHIAVYDDVSGKILTLQEINDLEEKKNALSLPLVIDELESERIFTPLHHIMAYEKCRTKKGKIKKMRLPIPLKLKKYIISRSSGICEYCSINEGKHIHHINGLPDDNHENNLMHICEPCHIKIHKEMKDSQLLEKNTEISDDYE